MKLLTKKNLTDLQTQDPYHASGPGREPRTEEYIALVKFFTPDSSWTWYALSASENPETGDVQLYGLVQGLETEFGYFWLSELKKIRGPMGLSVERDMYFKPIPLTELQRTLSIDSRNRDSFDTVRVKPDPEPYPDSDPVPGLTPKRFHFVVGALIRNTTVFDAAQFVAFSISGPPGEVHADTGTCSFCEGPTQPGHFCCHLCNGMNTFYSENADFLTKVR